MDIDTGKRRGYEGSRSASDCPVRGSQAVLLPSRQLALLRQCRQEDGARESCPAGAGDQKGTYGWEYRLDR